MPRFRTELVPGAEPPYDTWASVVVPADVRQQLGGGARIAVCGTVAGAPFRSTIAKGDGVHRFPVPRALRDAAGVDVGDRVDVVLDVDRKPRPIDVPVELREVLESEQLQARFDALAPSCRRAWAEHVAQAKRAATRVRRARSAPGAIRAGRFPGAR